MEFNGSIVRIGQTEVVSDKFQKRAFVVSDNHDQYPQNIQFELQQTKCDTIDSFKVGDAVRVSFNLRGRDWTDKEGVVKTFNTLQAWAIVKAGSAEKKTPGDDF